jgi:hypothetical protein
VALILGQVVRRVDRPDVGVIVGFLFGPPEGAIIRRVREATFEAMEDVIAVRQPAA